MVIRNPINYYRSKEGKTRSKSIRDFRLSSRMQAMRKYQEKKQYLENDKIKGGSIAIRLNKNQKPFGRYKNG